MTQKESSTSPVGVNCNYIRNYPLLEEEGHRVLLPSTKAMQWCMLACGIHRIFTEQDLREFLFRLPIALHHLHLLNNWFAYDELMNYKVGGQSLTFSVNDIFAHYGIEVCDSVINYTSRDQFFQGIDTKLKGVVVVGIFTGVEVIPFEYDPLTETTHIRVGKVSNSINDKLLLDAQFFASDVLRQAPKDLFEQQDRFKEKLLEIESRRKRIAELPTFDLSKLPSELIDTCMDLMFDESWVKDCRMNAPDDYKDLAQKYIFLAWAFANDLMVINDGMAFPVEGLDLNPEDYEEDCGFNLLHTYDSYNLKEVGTLLRV